MRAFVKLSSQPSGYRYSREIAIGLVRGLAASWLSFVAVLLITSMSSALLFNGPTVVITSGSMAPLIDVGDVVATVAPDDELDDGAIITYTRNGSRVTHRLLGIEGGLATTMGDANASPDSMPVPVASIEGQLRLVVPFAGLPRYWWQAGRWVTLGLWGLGTLAALDVLVVSRLGARRDAAERIGAS